MCDIVAMAISNHLDDDMHEHYSTVSGAEMTQAVAEVIDPASLRNAHKAPETLLKKVALPHDQPHE